MASSFDGAAIFGSGPRRFMEEKIGEYVLLNRATDPFLAGSSPIGPLELRVTVTGRLVAATNVALRTIRDAIEDKLTDPPTSGTLVDENGHSYSGMSFVDFEVSGPTDHGRTVSVGYTARFIKFLDV